jgi:cold shock CspA family protein
MAQGTVKSYDPRSKQGYILLDGTYEEVPLSIDALNNSIFRFLREGQRVVGEIVERDGVRQITHIRLGQESY